MGEQVQMVARVQVPVIYLAEAPTVEPVGTLLTTELVGTAEMVE
jgi:hypothetical protein